MRRRSILILLTLLVWCLGLCGSSYAMKRVPLAKVASEATSENDLIQITMKRDAIVTVVMPGYPEFVYPKAVPYINEHRQVSHLQQRTFWVGRRLADHLVDNGYADYK